MAAKVLSLPMWVGGGRSNGLRDRRVGRFVLAGVPLWVAWLAAGLTVVAALGFSSQALAGGAPGRLEDDVATIAEQFAEGPVEWARYVATSADTAAGLLGKSRDQLFEGTPDRVYLVVMRGDFSMEDAGEGHAPYLAFLYWHDDSTWSLSDFTLLQRPVPMESAGVPQVIEPSFALAHPTLNQALQYTLACLVWFGPAVLLAISVILCAWKRRSGWPYVLAACVAVAVAGWQAYVMVRSMSGQSWDPVFHGIKLATLAVVVCVDVAAALVVLRARPSPEAVGRAGADRPTALRAGLLLLVVAAALYVVSLPWLGTTGE